MSFTLFAYGSLLTHQNFPIKSQRTGYITGHVRRFAQKSTDHRGTTQRPGRVVTIIPTSESTLYQHRAARFPPGMERQEGKDDGKMWGIVYEIDEIHAAETRAYLDRREKNGFTLEKVVVYCPEDNGGTEDIPAYVYVGHVTNSEFVTEYETEEMIAKVILEAEGPSGPNLAYLESLHSALQPIQYDAHVEAIFAWCRYLRASA